ncbi:hypothetical protein BSKO_13538 [Bryopsis sp. KO-2023]|nr:hypothetical protein BSKO_13538 [Bryopsis sp. KO-2023]
MVSQRTAEFGRISSQGCIGLFFAAFFLILRPDIAGAQNCDAIFEGSDFSVTQGVLDEIKNDFQKLVDCVPHRGKLAIEPGLIIKPTTTVVIKDAIKLTSGGQGKQRPVFTCPGVGKPLLEISSTGVELENFVVSDCATESKFTSAVVVDIGKDKGTETASLEITGVDFVENKNLNGSASMYIKSAESLSLTKVAFSRNVGTRGGGVFLNSPGMEVKVKDCVFEENLSVYFGKARGGKGAALFQKAPAFITVTGSRFLNNHAASKGGALHILGKAPASTLAITNTEFLNNTAGTLNSDADDDGGGAIWAKGPTLKMRIENCTMNENKAVAQGGGIFLLQDTGSGRVEVDIEDSVFEENIAHGGGVIWAQASIQWKIDLSISNSKFLRNEASLRHVLPGTIPEAVGEFPFSIPGRGGAIRCVGRSIGFTSKGNLFQENTAIGLGGAGQTGPEGGAVYLASAKNITMMDTVFKGNSARNLDALGEEASGGAIYLIGFESDVPRVLDSPPGSQCELQCGSYNEFSLTPSCESFGSDSRDICVLVDATECEGLLLEENFIQLEDRPDDIAALCEKVLINTKMRLSNTKFENNTVDGAGGAIFLTGKGTILTLEKGVEFLKNTAKNSRGGALAISEGATLVAEEEMMVKDNVAGLHGGGIVLEGESANLNLVGAYFSGNEAKRGSGGAIALLGTGTTITTTGLTLFGENEAGKSGGAIACLSEDSDITFTDTAFINNKATVAGGALHAKAKKILNIKLEDVEFSGNHMGSSPEFPLQGSLPLGGKGGAMSLDGTGIVLSISGKTNKFANNTARDGGAIQLFDTKSVEISQSSFSGNVALSGGGLLVFLPRISDGLAVNLTDVEFTGNEGFMGGGLMVDARNEDRCRLPEDELVREVFVPLRAPPAPQISLDGVRFDKQRITKDGGAMFLVNVFMTGRNCDFQNNEVMEGFDGVGGAVKLVHFSRFDLTSGIFSGNQAVDGGAVFVSESLFNGEDVEFRGNSAFGNDTSDSTKGSGQKDKRLLLDDAAGTGRNRDFQEDRFGGGGGAVKLANFARFNLTSGIFSGNRAVDGGAVFVSESLFSGKDLELSKNFASGMGGSVWVEGPLQGNGSMVSLDDCNITGNFAEFGGGIFADVQQNSKGRSPSFTPLALFLNNTSISDNEAKNGGGGIFTRDPTLVCACCGTKCSEACQSLGQKSDFKLERACVESWVGNSHGEKGYGPMVASFVSSAIVMKSDGGLLQGNEVLDDSHNSGQPMVSLKVQIKDLFDQVVTVQKTRVFAEVTSESTGGQILSGQVDSQLKTGITDFNATIVSAFPGDYQMKMSFPDLKVGDIPFRVRVRECVRGETPVAGKFLTSFSCRQCETNSFSFRPSQSCKPCPTSTTCGTGTLMLIDGYWHSSSWSESIHKCLVDVACSYTNRSTILGLESEQSGAEPLHFRDYSLCREGYEGPLCGSCTKGYGRVRAFECQKCLAKPKTIPLMVLLVFWMLIVVGFIIRNALKAGTPANTRVNSVRNESLEPSPTIFLGVNPATENAKILINFLQITSIALVINVEWREEVRRALQLQDLASGFSANEGILSFDCPLEDSRVPVSIRRTILAMLLPFIMMVFPVFFVLRGWFDKATSQLLHRKAFVSSLVVAYVFYTGTTKRALRILQGVSVDPVESDTLFAQGRFWADDTNIRYFEGDHAYLAALLGLPVLVFYSFGFPGYLFYVLWGNEERLNDESFAKSYGFLYRAYHNDHVYWEIVVMARKALLGGVVVFAYELGGNLQSVLAVTVLMAALILHLHSQPYREELSQMNHRETLSLCVSVFTYLAGIAFNDDRLPVWSEVLLSVLLVAATIGLVIYLVLALAAESARHLTTLLQDRAVVVPENASTSLKMRLLVNFYWFRAMDSFWHFAEQGIAWRRDKKSQQSSSV